MMLRHYLRKLNVDTIVVTDGGKPVGMLDIQDMKG
jgi:hypothetical protein